ncbi:MAG: MBOAT family O-acyltransferase [Vicinamibacterales bacterium]
MSRLTSTHATAWTFRLIAWSTVAWLLGWRGVLLLVVAAVVTHGCALVLRAVRERPSQARVVLTIAVLGELALFAATIWPGLGRTGLPLGVGVFVCHAIAYLADVRAGTADPRNHGASLLYLVQLPVFPAGPLSRAHEVAEQVARADISMAGFSYGVRRIVTGLTKVYLVAGPLGSVASDAFALRVTRLSVDVAWVGAVCAALQVYYYVSGFSDVGIGLGKILGFRYLENFRRPFTADSIREFWRRWNVTLMTWLRDYEALPIAGHEAPTLRGYLVTAGGFIIIGAWQGAGLAVIPWAAYSAGWLALEAIGLGAVVARAPRAVRHAYVLLVVLFGWMLLHASGPGPLLGYVEAMLGFGVVPAGGALTLLGWGRGTALVCAIFFAGPMIGNVSRWRVSVDAAVASLIMMCAATVVLLWVAVNPLRRLMANDPPARRR